MFSYGSLTFEPELPTLLRRMEPARLPGWRRCFNKWSYGRGIAPDLSARPDLGVPRHFRQVDLNRSLVLGVEPGLGLDGLVLVFDAPESSVLPIIDRRESGYNRVRVELENAEPAWTYLTKKDGGYYVGDLGLETTARVLLRATPRERDPIRARGKRYLEGVRDALSAADLGDPYLDDLYSLCARF